jgi:2-phosphosulfolactate phosphatase
MIQTRPGPVQAVRLSALRGIESLPLQEYACAVIDVLRASTTILCLFEHGASNVRVLGSVDAALALKAEGYTVMGERGDTPLPGFDADNSPHQAASHDWRGRRVAITTSNGTRAVPS